MKDRFGGGGVWDPKIIRNFKMVPNLNRFKAVFENFGVIEKPALWSDLGLIENGVILRKIWSKEVGNPDQNVQILKSALKPCIY